MGEVREQTIEIPGWAGRPWPVRVRTADGPAGTDTGVPALWVHGVPTSSDDFLGFLGDVGGIAFDLPGFGRSGKDPSGDFTMEGLGRVAGLVLDALGIAKVRLVVHDWGGAALQWAMREPERVDRLVVVDAVPLLPGYTWHHWARLWRTPVVGETTMRLTPKAVLRRALPGDLGTMAVEHFDAHTQAAILRLYRSAPPERLEAAGRDLGRLAGVPSLVVWGDRDPYLPTRFAHRYAERLGGAAVHVSERGQHWVWEDDPAAREAIASFVR